MPRDKSKRQKKGGEEVAASSFGPLPQPAEETPAAVDGLEKLTDTEAAELARQEAVVKKHANSIWTTVSLYEEM